MSTDHLTLRELRADFGRNRFLAMPVAGVLGTMLPTGSASIALFICTGATFPLGILIGRFIGEDLLETRTELDRLFGYAVLMSNLVWSIAIPFWLVEPTSLPLSVGVLAGLMWIPFSWLVKHWVGLFHAISRTVLCAAAWFVFPRQRFVVIPAIIVAIYLVTIVIILKRPWEQPSPKAAT